MTTMRMFPVRGRFAVSLASILLGSAALAAGLMADAQPGWAKHHHKSRPNTPASSDPCAALNVYIEKHIAQLKKLKIEIEKEQSEMPRSLGAAIERMEGKPVVDQEKTQALAQLRHEADTVNSMLHVQGCKTVNIDQELSKP